MCKTQLWCATYDTCGKKGKLVDSRWWIAAVIKRLLKWRNAILRAETVKAQTCTVEGDDRVGGRKFGKNPECLTTMLSFSIVPWGGNSQSSKALTATFWHFFLHCITWRCRIPPRHSNSRFRKYYISLPKTLLIKVCIKLRSISPHLLNDTNALVAQTFRQTHYTFDMVLMSHRSERRLYRTFSYIFS